MDVTTGSDPFGYSPFARQTTEFVDPKSNPSTMKIPDFQEHLYTWPLPIVTGEPGKIKHPNRAFAYNAKPPVNANHPIIPSQSTKTPYPMINHAGQFPQYPGNGNRDWLHLAKPDGGGGGSGGGGGGGGGSGGMHSSPFVNVGAPNAAFIESKQKLRGSVQIPSSNR